MSAKDRPRFDIDALRDLAGEKVFARGKEYFSDGQVQMIALEPERALAQVDGTEIYRTEVTGRGKSIGGECSCRAFEDWGFCKHMVATALAANAAGRGADAEGVGALSRIRDHLKGKGIDALIEMIVSTEAWDKLPPRSGRGGARHELSGGYDRLNGILDFFAERDGDVDARIALRAKDLSSPGNYLRLAEFCISQGRKEEALRRAEEGLWVFEDDRPDEGFVLFTVDLLSKAGRKKDAEARLWRTFEQQPSFDLYARLRKLGGEAARARVVEFLEAKLGERRPGLLTAEFLMRILVHEKMFHEAWAIARKHEVSLGWRTPLPRQAKRRIRARRSRSTPSATGSPTPAAIRLTRKR